jgi:hypothetical protein
MMPPVLNWLILASHETLQSERKKEKEKENIRTTFY